MKEALIDHQIYAEGVPLEEIRVVRGGKVVDVSATDLRDLKKRKKLRKRRTPKRRGPMSASQKAKISRAQKKSHKLKKRT